MSNCFPDTPYPIFLALIVLCLFLADCNWFIDHGKTPFTNVATVAGFNKEFGEPFGIAIKGEEIFISDGMTGKIWQVSKKGEVRVFSDKFDTPSQITFDSRGDLIVADSGTHTIKKIRKNGQVELMAGTENKSGDRDGDKNTALFNAPIGVAAYQDKIFVADTYNDRIRMIKDGIVSTISGGSPGFADSEIGASVQFDTPSGLAVWSDGRILVADTGNRRIRVVEQTGKTWTLSGNGGANLVDGMLHEAEFVQPRAIGITEEGIVYIADGNVIRAIGRRSLPIVETLTKHKRGFFDGKPGLSQFNRPSGLAVDFEGNMFVADSENQLLRVFTGLGVGKSFSVKGFDNIQISAVEFRKSAASRWMYDPPTAKREIAGTFGEIRGEIQNSDSQVWIHNGLDVAGGYGETARFIRDGKVLHPLAVQNFDTTRELIRMPTIGYIHIRLGRNENQIPYDDKRFQFQLGADGKPANLRIPRGTKFAAGDAIGSLNTFNHVHLITGHAGREMNPLGSLDLPGVSDSLIPIIEEVRFFDESWREIETEQRNERIILDGEIRIVLRAYDQMDGNAGRRKLGLYKLGYQILDVNEKPVKGFEEPEWTIRFDKSPDEKAVKLVYAPGSQSGATGETVFNYIVTNRVSGRTAREDFANIGSLRPGKYLIRVFAADFFGNIASKDIAIEKN